MFIRKIYYGLPLPARSFVRRVFYLPHDTVQYIFKSKDEIRPPKGIIFVGSGDFVEKGKVFLEYFKELGHLKPEHHVLDVGCGIGRMAIPMTKFLNESGSYKGFDIVKKGINWCKKNISKRYPNFEFQHLDIFNPLYNTKGKLESTEFKFPYKDESFDFVFLTSVFTHMLPEDVEHYMSEISRVLKQGGHCFITYFVLDDISRDNIKTYKSEMAFPHYRGHYRLMDQKVNTANVAFNLKYLDALYKDNGLSLEGGVFPGWWSGRERLHDFQDIVVGVKL